MRHAFTSNTRPLNSTCLSTLDKRRCTEARVLERPLSFLLTVGHAAQGPDGDGEHLPGTIHCIFRRGV